MNPQDHPEHLKIAVCEDDKSIIEYMKKAGIWEQMKEMSRPGETISLVANDELFIWHGTLNDTGYSYFKCLDASRLLLIAAEATGLRKAG